MEGQQSVCLLCECPALDGVVPLSTVNTDRLQKWSLTHFGLQLGPLDIHNDIICSSCVLNARLLVENNEEEDGEDYWWLKEEENAPINGDNIKLDTIKTETIDLDDDAEDSCYAFEQASEISLPLFNDKEKIEEDCHSSQSDCPLLEPEQLRVRKEPPAKGDSMKLDALKSETIDLDDDSEDSCYTFEQEREISKPLICNKEAEIEEDCHSQPCPLVEAEQLTVLKGRPAKGGNAKRWECNCCGKTYASKKGLKRHMQDKHKDYKFKCSFWNCADGFKSQENLHLHFEEQHSGQETFACELCTEKFVCLQSLKQHVIGKHPKAKGNIQKNKK